MVFEETQNLITWKSFFLLIVFSSGLAWMPFLFLYPAVMYMKVFVSCIQ